MTKVSLFTLAFIAILSGCGGGDTANSMNSSSNAVSYEPDFATTQQAGMPAANSNTAAKSNAPVDADFSAESVRRHTPQIRTQKISLVQTEAAAIDTASSDRKIIRNAELNLEAENPEDAQRKITSIAELRGGFVVESQQSSSDIKATSRDIVAMTVRVPSARFSETLADIRNTSTRVVLETVKGQDVTEEFIDIEAQVKAKKALEQQFMEIMKRANTVGDALNVQSQLADVRGEIERVEGRKRFLENQSSLSTIKIRLQTAKVFAASSTGFGDRVAASFAAGADVALNFVLGLVTIVVAVLPFALFVGLPAFLIVRYFWRKQAGPRSVVELAEDELKST